MATQYDFDLAVIGAGTAGLVSAFVASSLGARVALIEKAKVGGECLWTGCVPSKTLIKSARVWDTIKRAEEFGVHVEEPKLVWRAVQLRIADVRDEIRGLEREELAKTSIQQLVGDAEFVAPHELRISSKDGERLISARQFILAVGTRVRVPQIPGLEDTGYLSHETIFDVPNLPRSMTILGGGPIGCEFAQAFARFGTQVTLLQKGERLLPKDDEEISAAAQRVLENDGVTVHTGVQVESAGRDDKGVWLQWQNGGEAITTRASKLLLATGKTAFYDPLRLDTAGVRWNDGGIETDAQGRTTASHIWACGDCTGGPAFTHAAEYAAKIVAQNALLPVKSKLDLSMVPWTTFLDPEVAHVGLTESEARAQWGQVKVYRSEFKKLDRAIIEGETQGFCKLVATGSGRLVGAHIIGANAGEIIHHLVPFVKEGAIAGELAEMIHVYPTLSEIARRAGNEYFRELLDSRLVQGALRVTGLEPRRNNHETK